MLKKLLALGIVTAGVVLTYGCGSTYSFFGPTQSLRRVMIAGEQLKLSGQDLERAADLADYPTSGRWNH